MAVWAIKASRNRDVNLMIFLVVSSIRQRSINSLVCMLWFLQFDGVTRPHSTSHPFSEHYRQADLYMLALRVVTARVHVVLNGSFTFPN